MNAFENAANRRAVFYAALSNSSAFIGLLMLFAFFKTNRDEMRPFCLIASILFMFAVIPLSYIQASISRNAGIMSSPIGNLTIKAAVMSILTSPIMGIFNIMALMSYVLNRLLGDQKEF